MCGIRAVGFRIARPGLADVQREGLVRLVPDVLVHVRPKREALGQAAIIGVSEMSVVHVGYGST